MPTCSTCSQQFEIIQKELDFYARLTIPLPNDCPHCRLQQRLSFRNERTLYKRTCDLCGKGAISMFSPDKPFKQYCNECFYGDKWDAATYGQEFDFTRPFFNQLKELQLNVPRLVSNNMKCENCDFVNMCSDDKNCYLTFAAENSEDCYYCKLCQKNKNCIDCDFVWDSELCYGCVNIEKCYECFQSVQLKNCTNCHYCFELQGCKNCLFCHNLVRKEYCILNKQCSKEEFEEKLRQIENGPAYFCGMLKNEAIHRANNLLNCEDSTGDNLSGCRDMYQCFDMQNSEHCGYCAEGDAKYCWDCTNIYLNPELCCQNMSTLQTYNVKYGTFIYYSSDLTYCDSCWYSKNLFGCIGLQHKEYCILNRQYTKEEYEKLIPQIIDHMKRAGEWGKFFPKDFSPFCYNETIAMEYFPLSKDEITKLGYLWKEPDRKNYLPPSGDILACESCGKNYKIQASEEKFYQKYNLETPTLCPDCRHMLRFQFKNPKATFPNACSKCGKAVQTSYQSKQVKNLYCESCYNEAVY